MEENMRNSQRIFYQNGFERRLYNWGGKETLDTLFWLELDGSLAIFIVANIRKMPK